MVDLVFDVGIFIDGLWNKRGWFVRDGVVEVILIDIGKVLDVVFLFNSCTILRVNEKETKGWGYF